VTAIDLSETSPELHARSQRNIACGTSIFIGSRSRKSGSSGRCSIRSSARRAPPSSARPGYRPSLAARRPCAHGAMQPDGLCNIWACRHLHDAGVPAAGSGSAPRRKSCGTSAPRSVRYLPTIRSLRVEAGEGFQKSGRTRRCTAPPSGSCLHTVPQALCVATAMRHIVQGAVRAGSLSPAMRRDGAYATQPRVSSRFRRNCSTPRSSFFTAGPGTSTTSIAYRADRVGESPPITFEGDAWRGYVPLRLPWTLCIRDRVPPGFGGRPDQSGPHLPPTSLSRSMRHRSESLPQSTANRSIDEIQRGAAGAVGDEQARRFIEQLWEYDQIVFDATGSH